ncbi:Legume-like lectin family protein [Histomonas meleagridis]|uniref:Legume-like lectin family protein n=1 Tax=Histomonas meleagridis TaxID=135588 RepID=UPI003559EB4C|nr:Legume-like lectin family protein [Histomonas meleagridis]KAH0798692.1 Legume-like lectin family protein [Histomonas meleagridis]
MMFFGLFQIFCNSITPDLTPPFYPNSKNRIGYWDIGGAAIVEEDHIILSPPIQYHKGSIWNTLPTPYGEFSIDFKLRIDEGTGGGGFGIWFIEQHGASGPLYGGPEKFRGAACIGVVSPVNQENKLMLKLSIFQSDGTISHNTINQNSDSDSTIYLSKEPFVLRLHISSTICVYNYTDSNNPILLINKTLTVDLSKAWLGITGMSDEFTSKIDLLYAKFDTNEYINQHFLSKQKRAEGQDPRVNPQKKSNLRNPSFSIMNREIDSFRIKSENDKEIINVLDVVDEFGKAICEIATYGELNSFVDRTLVPYVQNWHRRTFKIVESVQNAKQMMGKAMNQTNALLYIFNHSIYEMMEKSERKIGKLNDLLNDGMSEDKEFVEKIEEEAQPKWVTYVKYISLLEVVGILLFFISTKVTQKYQL